MNVAKIVVMKFKYIFMRKLYNNVIFCDSQRFLFIMDFL